jgi:hypothetical protein
MFFAPRALGRERLIEPLLQFAAAGRFDHILRNCNMFPARPLNALKNKAIPAGCGRSKPAIMGTCSIVSQFTRSV